MLKILWKHFLSNMVVWILISAVIFFCFGAAMKFGSDNMFAFGESYTVVVTFMLGIWTTTGKLKIIQFSLPEVLYIMPISRTERIQLTQKLLRMYWFAMGLLVVCCTSVPIIWKLSVTGQLNLLTGVLICIQIVMVWVAVYPLLYIQYIDTDYTGILIEMIYTIVEVVVNVAICETIANEIVSIGLVIFAGVICVLNILIDIWYHKRYFDEMIQFYCEFESVRRLAEMKDKNNRNSSRKD